jgi:hypothetical protein
LIKTIFKNFPDIYTHLGTNLYYIPIVISKSAHPSVHYVGTITQKMWSLYVPYDLYGCKQRIQEILAWIRIRSPKVRIRIQLWIRIWIQFPILIRPKSGKLQ